jgi:hypothetical protein
MRKSGFIFVLLLFAVLQPRGFAQVTNTAETINGQLETNAKPAQPKVTAVYGVTADDYLPVQDVARQYLRPNVRGAASHPAFDLPDAFYFIGGPIFLLLLLRVLVIFLNGFEEKRKEEERQAASEQMNAD